MKKIFWLAMLLVVVVFSYAIAASYTVVRGDTLSGIAKKYGISLSLLKRLNPEIHDHNKIYPGQSINLNGEIQSAESESSGERVWREVGANPYRGTHWRAIESFDLPSFVKDAALKNFDNDNFEWVRIESGMQLGAVTFGRNEIWENVRTEWDETKIYAAKDYGTEDYVVAKVSWCNNWVWWKKEKKQIVRSLPPPPRSEKAEVIPPPLVKEKPKEGDLPPIFQKVPVEKSRVTYDNELDLGGGLWKNQDNSGSGNWWFAQYKLFLTKNSTGLADGTLTPFVGAFAKGDSGIVDSGYEWENWGVGPQAGIMWNGMTKKGYPQQVQMMLRAIYMHMHGYNDWTGYSKKQEHILIGYYLEYLRRFHPEYMTILYAEGWFDVGSSYKSTWSGDSANDLTQFVVGVKLHKDLSEKWAARFGAQVGYQIEEDRVGANVHAELRYSNWLIFGPSFDYCLKSGVIGEAGEWAAGVFARVELHHAVKEKYTEYRMQKVERSDKQLIDY